LFGLVSHNGILHPSTGIVNSALPHFTVPVTIPPIVKLYHGTSERIGRLALTKGLSPRKLTGQSNWKHMVESHPDLVYLTTVYAPYFGLQAAKGKKMAIVEVETDLLDEFKMLPDEDFIEQVTRADKKNKVGIEGRTLNERTEYIRNYLDEFSGFWRQSSEFPDLQKSGIGQVISSLTGDVPKHAPSHYAATSIHKFSFSQLVKMVIPFGFWKSKVLNQFSVRYTVSSVKVGEGHKHFCGNLIQFTTLWPCIGGRNFRHFCTVFFLKRRYRLHMGVFQFQQFAFKAKIFRHKLRIFFHNRCLL
jgi:hypothetical protein